MKLKPYPKYKDSGVSWLGEIPVHWELHKGKRLFTKMERDIRLEDGVVTCFRDGIVTLRKNRRTSGFTESLKEIGYQGIRKGDLVIHMMDAFAGAVGVSDSDGKGTPVYSVCQPKLDLNTYFYSYIVREMARSDYILSLAKGIRERSTDFRFDAFASQVLPVPPKQEQDEISAYIRGQSSKINRFIRNKRSLIKLLNEQKQVIINQAVTRGIDLNVPLKSSDVSYIGNVSAHWDIVRLKYLFAEVDDRSPTGGETLLSLRMYKGLVPHAEVSDKPIASTELIGYKRVKKPEIVMNRMRASVGMFAVTSSPGIVSPDYAIFRQITEVSPDYYVHLFKTPLMRARFRIESRGLGTGSSGFLRLYSESFGSIFVPKAPIEEQVKIVDYIDKLTGKMNTAIERTHNEIELIQEYRNRLISDVITGKIDVRDIEIPALPDEDAVEDLEDEELLDVAEAELEAVEEADE